MIIYSYLVIGFAGVLTVLNAAQVVLGRQIFRASKSRRTTTQVRRESFAASLAMGAMTVAAVSVFVQLPFGLILGAFAIAITSFGSIFVLRRRDARDRRGDSNHDDNASGREPTSTGT